VPDRTLKRARVLLGRGTSAEVWKRTIKGDLDAGHGMSPSRRGINVAQGSERFDPAHKITEINQPF
jgi:hypothetical protein